MTLLQTPEIFFGADDLYGLADTEPPLTKALSEEELLAVVEEPLLVDLPNNTMAVERGVKETTAAALRCAEPVLRDGITFQIADARKRNKN